MVPYNQTISFSVQAEFFFCNLEVNSEQNMSREKPVCLKQQAWRVIHRITPLMHFKSFGIHLEFQICPFTKVILDKTKIFTQDFMACTKLKRVTLKEKLKMVYNQLSNSFY